MACARQNFQLVLDPVLAVSISMLFVLMALTSRERMVLILRRWVLALRREDDSMFRRRRQNLCGTGFQMFHGEALDALTHSDAGLTNLGDISAMLRLHIKPA